jgi:hypothetical protein
MVISDLNYMEVVETSEIQGGGFAKATLKKFSVQADAQSESEVSVDEVDIYTSAFTGEKVSYISINHASAASYT